MRKVIGFIFGLLPISAFAVCTPTPDCATLGFTDTSCGGRFIRCPFDISKLLCIPCDSLFKYSCVGEYIVGGIGSACNNKYTACECVDGTTFVDGECTYGPNCNIVGNIVYSDRICSPLKLANKTPIGIVAYKDDNRRLLLSLDSTSMSWTTSEAEAEGNVSKLNELTIYTNSETALTDYNGFNNTKTIVEAYGENTAGVAAAYCYNYAPTGWESSKGQWYLPAAGELYNAVYNNKTNINNGLTTLGLNSLDSGYHWSSTRNKTDYVWYVNSGTGYVSFYTNKSSYPVRCIREF